MGYALGIVRDGQVLDAEGFSKLPVDEQKIVFEAFRSMDKSGSKSVAASTGLGLAIARNLAEMMGGEIKLQSKLGVGSTFEVRLPLIVPDKQEAIAEMV